MSKNKGHNYSPEYDYETYETKHEWITPIGEYNIVHLDCPTEEEIKKRVTDFINEVVNGEGFDDDCPLCQLMASHPYNVVYYCTKFCHECEKVSHCKNFNPNSRDEEKNMNALIDKQVEEDDIS